VLRLILRYLVWVHFPLTNAVTGKLSPLTNKRRGPHYNIIETCPQINFLVGRQQCQGIIDTGCQTSIVSENMFNELTSNGVPSLQLPAQHVMLVSALGGKSKRIRKQVMLELKFENKRIDHFSLFQGNL
jgi:hypothetical protein